MKNIFSHTPITVIILTLFISVPSRACSEIHRAKYQAHGYYLIVEVLDDDLFHFEYGAGNGPGTDIPIPTTEMVCGAVDSLPPAVWRDFSMGPRWFSDDGKGVIETENTRLEINMGDISIAVINRTIGDIHLTTVSPLYFDQPFKGLEFTRTVELDVYGLGQQFVEPGESNIDWDGRIREGSSFGNVMAGFDYGATGNTQIPVMYAVNGATFENYAVFMDITRKLRWDFTGRTEWTVSMHGDQVRFFILNGPDLLDLRKDFMDIVGHPLVPPRKMFGMWLSEFGFDDWYEVGDRRKTLHDNNFPIDGFVLDLQWFGGIPSVTGRCMMGSLDFDETKFFTPSEVIRGYSDRFGIGFMVIEEPYVCDNLPEFDELKDRGYLVGDGNIENQPAFLSGFWGEGGMFDYTNDDCCRFVHDTERQKLIDAGIIGHWTDLGEPEVFDPQSVYSVGNHADAHNIYNFRWIRGIYRGYISNRVPRRPFMMSRSGTAGIQRFGAAMWSGDIASRLTSLAAHAANQMHMSMSGIDYYGADIGGFHRNLQGDQDEMYTQWYAYGMMFDIPGRPHVENLCNCKNNAPDRIGHLESNLANTRLRYSLIPYIYSLAHRAYLYGEPVMPPLVIYYQTDDNVRSIGHEKMIGRDLLAAIVARHGETKRNVYLPEGVWYDWYSNRQIESNGEWIENVPEYRDGIFRLPLYARAGAVIPMMHIDDETLNSLGERKDGEVHDELIIKAFGFDIADATAEHFFTLFEDDGTSIEYQNGAVRETVISQKRSGDTTTITVGAAVGTYERAIEYRDIIIDLIGMTSNDVVYLNGETLMRFSDTKNFESARVGWIQNENRTITVKSGVRLVSDAKIFRFIANADN
jgi:alpha-glucosidase